MLPSVITLPLQNTERLPRGQVAGAKVRHRTILSVRKEGMLMNEIIPYSYCNARGRLTSRHNAKLVMTRRSIPRTKPFSQGFQPRSAGLQADPNGRKRAPHEKPGNTKIGELGCSFDSAYQRQPVSVAARRRDAMFLVPAKDTETLHVPVVSLGVRRLITVLRASGRCSPEALYFQMSLPDGYAPWPYVRDTLDPESDQRMATDSPDP